MEKTYKSPDIEEILTSLDEKIDIVFRHQMLFSLYRSIPRDYGRGYLMSEVDVHTLGYIQENPGILAKQIAEMTYRSKGTVSLSLSKLEEQGLLEQRVNPKKKSERNLYVTPAGEEVCRRHREYDRKTTYAYIMDLLKHCTPEEINGFYKVSYYRCELFEDIIQNDRKIFEQDKKRRSMEEHAEKERTKGTNVNEE